MPSSIAPRRRALPACGLALGLLVLTGACAPERGAPLGPRGTALPPPGLDPAADAAAAAAMPPPARPGAAEPSGDARPEPGTAPAAPRGARRAP